MADVLNFERKTSITDAGFPRAQSHTGISGDGGGGGMEARVAKLQSDVEHIQSDIAEIKVDGRDVRDKISGIKDSISSAKIWALLLYIGLAAALLTAMARGFNWI
ncbi:MAG: hypothetical protein ACREV9_04415 [Burkholderiales bacterium]